MWSKAIFAEVSTFLIAVPLALVILGTFTALMNWGIVVRFLWRGTRSSNVPFVGGLLCAAGIALWPGGALRPLWPLLFVLDPTFLLTWLWMLALLLMRKPLDWPHSAPSGDKDHLMR